MTANIKVNMSDALLQERIRAVMPDLAITDIEHNTEGLMNDVVIVNHQLVFRFAKSEKSTRLMEAELKLLDYIRPHLGVGVPTPSYRGMGAMAYPFLDGLPLSRTTLLGLGEANQQSLAEQIGAFLYRLHSLPLTPDLPPTRAPVKRERWVELRDQTKAKIYPLLQNYQIEWANGLWHGALETPGFFDYAPALIHGDLASYHLLFDAPTYQLTGVIDFGMAGIGDAASDFGNLISIYGETFVRRMRPTYPALETLLPRARFYAQGLELEWTLLGLETGEQFWFTGHLGGARDIQG